MRGQRGVKSIVAMPLMLSHSVEGQSSVKGEYNDPFAGRGADVGMQTDHFAAGDVRHNSFRQVITAAGDGATAAMSAFKYVKE